MDAFSDVAPPDKADRTPLDDALRALLDAVTGVRSDKPRIVVTLEQAEWDKVRTYYQRPYRPRPLREFCVSMDGGLVWFELAGAQQEAALTHVVVPVGMTLEEARRTGQAEELRNPVLVTDLVPVETTDGRTWVPVRVDPAMPSDTVRLEGAGGQVVTVTNVAAEAVANAKVMLGRDALSNPAMEKLADLTPPPQAPAPSFEATYGGVWKAPEDKS